MSRSKTIIWRSTEAVIIWHVVNYLPRVKVPVLQFNGIYDTDFRFETSAKPFFNLIGTAEADKKLVAEATGHFVPKSDRNGGNAELVGQISGSIKTVKVSCWRFADLPAHYRAFRGCP